jgi:DNA-binding response OmpR family regulator
MMGEIDGIEVMNVARQQATPPEVILLTGQSSVETAIAAVRAGAFDYMIKPCLVPRLLARVAEAVDQHRTRQQVLAHASAEQAVGEPEPVAPAPDAPAAPTAPAEAAEAAEADRYLSVGQLRIDTYRREVCFAQEPLHITPTEYTILVELAARPERVVGYSELAFATHGVDLDASEAHDLLRHHVRNLRRKLAAGYLVGVRSTGYMLDPQD